MLQFYSSILFFLLSGFIYLLYVTFSICSCTIPAFLLRSVAFILAISADCDAISADCALYTVSSLACAFSMFAMFALVAVLIVSVELLSLLKIRRGHTHLHFPCCCRHPHCYLPLLDFCIGSELGGL